MTDPDPEADLDTETWATVDDVLQLTAATVTVASVVQAQGMIEGLINRNWRDSDTADSDIYWLKRAVAWQAKFVDENGSQIFNTPVGATSLSQDGMSISWSGDGTGGGGTGGSSLRHISGIARTYLNNLRDGANASMRVNSAFDQSAFNRRVGWRSIGRRSRW